MFFFQSPISSINEEGKLRDQKLYIKETLKTPGKKRNFGRMNNLSINQISHIAGQKNPILAIYWPKKKKIRPVVKKKWSKTI